MHNYGRKSLLTYPKFLEKTPDVSAMAEHFGSSCSRNAIFSLTLNASGLIRITVVASHTG